jgi:hypothetical protein
MFTSNDISNYIYSVFSLIMFAIFFGNKDIVYDICAFIFLMTIVVLSYDTYVETLNCK